MILDIWLMDHTIKRILNTSKVSVVGFEPNAPTHMATVSL